MLAYSHDNPWIFKAHLFAIQRLTITVAVGSTIDIAAWRSLIQMSLEPTQSFVAKVEFPIGEGTHWGVPNPLTCLSGRQVRTRTLPRIWQPVCCNRRCEEVTFTDASHESQMFNFAESLFSMDAVGVVLFHINCREKTWVGMVVIGLMKSLYVKSSQVLLRLRGVDYFV